MHGPDFLRDAYSSWCTDPPKGGQALQLLLATSPLLPGTFRKDTLSLLKIQELHVPVFMAMVDEEANAKPPGRPHTLHG